MTNDLEPFPNESHKINLVKPIVYQSIDAAIRFSIGDEKYEPYATAMDGYYCGLPPIIRDSNIVSLSEGVLRGEIEKLSEFKARLTELRSWNKQNSSTSLHSSLSTKDHQKILSKEFISDYKKSVKINRTPHASLNERAVITLIGAAIAAGSGDPVAINQNVGTIVNQLCGLNIFNSLFQRSLSVLSGQSNTDSFLQSLNLLGGTWNRPEGIPEPPIDPDFGPQRPAPGNPFPCPNSPSWPPGSGPSSDPTLPGGLECLPEALEAFLDVIGPGLFRLRYEITSIEPQNACPGETVTIRGSRLSIEDSIGIVKFRSDNPREPLIAEPISWSDSEIQVVVPEGTICGPVELALSEDHSVMVCGATVRLNLVAESELLFQGGITKIDRFGIARPSGRTCLMAGDSIVFNFGGCNPNSITLKVHSGISSEEGTTYIDLTLTEESFGSVPFTIPELDENTLFNATFSVSGPCGSDSETITFWVERSAEITDEERSLIGAPSEFKNWNHNIQRSLPQATPANLQELISVVKVVEEIGGKAAPVGSAWSFTECTTPDDDESNDVVIDTCSLDRILDYSESSDSEGTERFLPSILKDDLTTILSPYALSSYDSAIEGGLSDVSERLVYVEAGIKIKKLIRELYERNMALATMGGGDGQSLAGAISTGTHGGTIHLQPIADFVRAIHLVGSNGQQWWIEPRSRSISDREAMERARGVHLDPCIRIEYDDNLFYSALVSFGSAGVIYGLVYEIVDQHNMRYITEKETWEESQVYIREKLLSDLPAEDVSENPWFLEILVNSNESRRSFCQLTSDEANPCIERSGGFAGGASSEGFITFLQGLAIPTVLAAALGPYIAKETFLWGWYIASFQWKKAGNAKRKMRIIRQFVHAAVDAYRIILTENDPDTLINESDEAIYDGLPNIINTLWEIGFILPLGKELVEKIQKHVTASQREERNEVLRSDLALKGGKIPHCDEFEEELEILCPSVWGISDGFSRLVESHEYVLPADRCIDFVNALLAAAEDITSGHESDALLVALPIRFTKPTNAVLGMQRPSFGICCHVEIFVMERLNGTDEFLARAREIANEFDAIPHWGQLHDETRNYRRLYGSPQIIRWRNAMSDLARTETGERLDTFRKAFAIDRGLI